MADIDKIQILENKINDMDKNQIQLREIINRFVENINRLSGVLDKFDLAIENLQISMIKMQGEISNNSKDMGSIKTKLDNLDENSKFDWHKFISNQLIPFLIGGGNYLRNFESYRKRRVI